MKRAPRWKPIPIQGMTLSRIRIESSGKRSEIAFQMLDGTTMTGGLGTITFERLDGVALTFRSLDDVYVELTIAPAADTVVAIDVGEVDYWLDETDSPLTLDTFGDFSPEFDYRLGIRVVS